MKNIARIGLGFAVIGAAALTHTSAIADEPHGVNFTIKSALDANFCFDATNATTVEGREVQLQVCAAKDTQRWAFTWNADNSVVIVGSQGMCVDVRRVVSEPKAVQIYKCHFGDNQRFTYTTTQHLREVHSGKCLSAAKAIAGQDVTLDKCDDANKAQVFTLGH